MVTACSEHHQVKAAESVPPPPPAPWKSGGYQKRFRVEPPNQLGRCCVSTATRAMWDRLFNESCKADVVIHTDNGSIVYAHADIIGTASPVIKGMLKQAKRHGYWQSIAIRGVPQDAVRAFIRFLYSSCYEKEDMNEFVMHLLVMSHVYVVPQLKQLCEWHLEQGLLTTENVVDVFQLSLLCDVPRLSVVSHRMILKNFKKVYASEAWKAMKKSHPFLEKELSDSMIHGENRRKEGMRKAKEQKVYAQLYEAMEALVHICRDGCRTIGPQGKDLKENEAPCGYEACKGLETLIRHFAGCSLRVPGGCVHCKRMWQLLELHSRLCADSNRCCVPLCRNFKERKEKQSKKEEGRWKLLVKNVLGSKRFGCSPFFLSLPSSSSP
ncbi:PREDICTED: BTB/POZ and TAZ domain-containing protein 4 [Tarenaya hassleriana]|uniref:BTB/POZ and TAZ domain-containing protein 4 n=1 Tax=Tarenaya hassleriana TaxID=28532 RepID=UPI00053C6E9D|nr:PREDICTED: BTB/POZ and TAZ domain-containing protein 4 [Tarenaya hassleriana]